MVAACHSCQMVKLWHGRHHRRIAKLWKTLPHVSIALIIKQKVKVVAYMFMRSSILQDCCSGRPERRIWLSSWACGQYGLTLVTEFQHHKCIPYATPLIPQPQQLHNYNISINTKARTSTPPLQNKSSRLHACEIGTHTKAMAEHSSMLPKLVCAFQRPMMRPLLPLPYQLAMIGTTDGHPLACTQPAHVTKHLGLLGCT